MIAAVYARKSTDQNGISDEEKSVTRQIGHAKAYAIKKGWTVADEHLYVDDGISGAEFVKRPGFLRLMNALKPRPAFQVLIMSEESRLGREQIETAYALKQIMDAGVRVFFYLEDRERTLETPLDKVMLSLTGFAAEMEREKARQRTYDAMRRKAEAGHVAGGKVYGYDNVEVLVGPSTSEGRGERAHVVRRRNAEEALVVCQIFTLYAGGKGLTRIAKHLNAMGVQPPRRGQHGWAPSAIREILYRPLYKGEIIWNQYQKVMKGGTKARRPRPENEWVHVDVPDLQIISPTLWQAVHDRLARAKRLYARGTQNGRRGTLIGRPTLRDFDSPYLLSGLARCSCGGPVGAVTREHKRSARRFYGCLYFHKRGPTVCSNSLLIDQGRVDQEVLQAISNRLITPERRERVVERALELLQARQEQSSIRQAALMRELSNIDGQLQNLLDAICRGGANVEALLERLKSEEARKKALMAELDRLSRSAQASLDIGALGREVRQRLADARSLLGQELPQARQILRKVLTEPAECQAIVANGQPSYRITLKGSYAHLLPHLLVATRVASHLIANWNQAVSWLRGMDLLKESASSLQVKGLPLPVPASLVR